ncbi:MAG: tol-pal system protein YbgF [Deltaproteobacteria bacterium]|nr:tol-pal system protein YbgF [Deltaproteobacteria bacterium]
MNKKIFFTSLVLFFAISLSVVAKQESEEPEEGTTGYDLTEIKIAVENHGKTLATMTNQLNEVITKFQEVSGETGRNFQKIKEQSRVIADTETRMQVLEDQISILTGQLQELVTEGLLSKESTKLFEEYKNYARGLEYINAKSYDKAIKEFSRFQDENNKSIFTSYAQFWIGESYFMQSDYAMAIKQYQKMLTQKPKSAKAPTALYKQGLSFYNLNSFEDAVAFFTKVIRTYPQSIESIQASAQIARINTILELKKQQELEMKMVQ